MRSTGKVRRQIPATSRPPEPAKSSAIRRHKGTKTGRPGERGKRLPEEVPRCPPAPHSIVHSFARPYINHSFIRCIPYPSSIYPHFLTMLSTNRSSIVHPAPPDRARGILTHHPPRTASGRPATPEAARDWVVPGDNSKDHQAPLRHHLAGTKPFVYNPGCKHFCTQKSLIIASNIKTEALTRESKFSFTTHPRT